MYENGIPMYTVYLGSGIRVPLLANHYNYSQNPKVSASSGGFGALQQYFDKLAVQQNMLYFSGTTTNAERALWDSLWKDTVPNMSFSQVVDVWLGMTQLTGGLGLSAKDAMTTTAYVGLYAGVNTGAVIQNVLAPVTSTELSKTNGSSQKTTTVTNPGYSVVTPYNCTYTIEGNKLVLKNANGKTLSLENSDYQIVGGILYVKSAKLTGEFAAIKNTSGSPYSSPLEAAAAFTNLMNSLSISTDTEFGTYIVLLGNGLYTYTPIFTIGKAKSIIAALFVLNGTWQDEKGNVWEIDSFAHTHAAYTSTYASDFSDSVTQAIRNGAPGDIQLANNANKDMYGGMPNGQLKQYTYATKTISTYNVPMPYAKGKQFAKTNSDKLAEEALKNASK